MLTGKELQARCRGLPVASLRGNYGSVIHRSQFSISYRGQPCKHTFLPTRSRTSKKLRVSSQQNAHFRTFLIGNVPSIVIPPVIFVGLLLTLWTYKCIMMVLFQDKIIYMPYMPPYARSEKLRDYAADCKPVEWEEVRIPSHDGTKIALAIGRMPEQIGMNRVTPSPRKEVLICYFQGNGSSTPPRLPLLSSVLKSACARTAKADGNIRFTLVALSYRGYWTSSGRASQSGIELDAQAMLQYVLTALPDLGKPRQLIFWGQSIGAGVASTAVAAYLAHADRNERSEIQGIVLETPFTSIKSMLLAMYPQKWLPYRYLSPFLWNHWDSEDALRAIAGSSRLLHQPPPRVLLVPATRDELVPREEADKLEQLCRHLNFRLERRDIVGAFHTDATLRREGQETVAKFLSDIATSN